MPLALQSKFQDKTARIAVVGLGYVGLPLVLAYSRNGYQTLGVDIDEGKTSALNAGESYIKHIESSSIQTEVTSGRLTATIEFSRLSVADAIILCVPTPLNQHFEPDLSYVTGTMEAIAPHLRAGQVVSLESTTYPGTTDEEIVTRVEKQGLKVGTDVFVVYSPEREDPGNPQFAATNIPKVVGGTTAACSKAGNALYGAVFDQVVPVSDTRVAELTKLLENIYRAVNIGLVNELKVVAEKMGIDIWEVINAAATKPFGFQPFYPGPGLGGHCIPIDPFYLTWKAREYGLHTAFIELAGRVNRGIPDYVIERCVEALNSRRKSVNGSKVLLVGLAYKPNVDDLRESPTFVLMDKLKTMGADVNYHDPHIPEIGPTREHMNWVGEESVSWTESEISRYDLVVISTWHDCLKAEQLVDWSSLIVDTRNAIRIPKGSSTLLYRA